MKSFFFDTSALFKIYHIEVGTEIVEPIYENRDNIIFTSNLSRVEFVSALCKRLRIEEIPIDVFDLAYEKFDYDCKNRFKITGFHSSLIDEAENLLKKHGRMKELRTLDAIQLAIFKYNMDKDCIFVCADKKLYRLAKEIGLKTLDF